MNITLQWDRLRFPLAILLAFAALFSLSNYVTSRALAYNGQVITGSQNCWFSYGGSGTITIPYKFSSTFGEQLTGNYATLFNSSVSNWNSQTGQPVRFSLNNLNPNHVVRRAYDPMATWSGLTLNTCGSSNSASRNATNIYINEGKIASNDIDQIYWNGTHELGHHAGLKHSLFVPEYYSYPSALMRETWYYVHTTYITLDDYCGASHTYVSSTYPLGCVYWQNGASSTKRCMDVAGYSKDLGGGLWQYSCNRANNQRIYRNYVSGSNFTLQLEHSSQCLDVYNNDPWDNTPIIQWDCHGGTNQQWYVWNSSSSGYILRSVSTGKCIQPQSNSDGSWLVQMTCNSSQNLQRWKYHYVQP